MHESLVETYPPVLSAVLEGILATDKRFSLSYREILSTFESHERVLAAAGHELPKDGSLPVQLLEQARAVRRRALDAATLNLGPDDYAIITGEHIYPSDTTPTQSTPVNPLFETHRLWGYETEQDMLDTEKDGLMFILPQFVVRAASFSFEQRQLMELTGGFFFGRRLAMRNVVAGNPFGSLADFRFFSLGPLDMAKGQWTINPLTETLCRELHSFVRLRGKCGWSVADLDIAICSLLENRSRANGGTLGFFDGDRGMSAELVGGLADAARLGQLINKPVAQILPLWGDINMHGDVSLYRKLFLSSPAMQLLGGDTFTSYLQSVPPLSLHANFLQAVLKVTARGLEGLLGAARLKPEDSTTIGSLSSLYRHSLLCQMLDILPEGLGAALQSFPTTAEFFTTPRATLDLVEAWRGLLEKEWSASDILSAINPAAARPPAGSSTSKATLSDDETQFFASGSRNPLLLNVDPKTPPTLADLVALESYRGLRDSAARTPASIPDLVQTLSTRPPSQAADIASQFAAAMHWPEARLHQVLVAKYPDVSAEHISKRLQDLDELVSLGRVMELLLRKVDPAVSVSLLFQMGTPAAPDSLSSS